METSSGPVLTEIRVHNETKRAAVCHRCGTKFYPPSLLDLHLDYHRVRDLFLEGEVKKLQATMGRMKNR
ncbi:MAG TPA: hypothetical protein VNL14_20815 [Candidatus Acidoferrales bacterium]|nr:hypothetical protein [Candidatus Acidoferrales bacterium]